MKKLIFVMMVLFLAGTFSSCQQKAEEKAAPEVQVETQAVDTTAAADTTESETPPPPPPQ